MQNTTTIITLRLCLFFLMFLCNRCCRWFCSQYRRLGRCHRLTAMQVRSTALIYKHSFNTLLAVLSLSQKVFGFCRTKQYFHFHHVLYVHRAKRDIATISCLSVCLSVCPATRSSRTVILRIGRGQKSWLGLGLENAGLEPILAFVCGDAHLKEE